MPGAKTWCEVEVVHRPALTQVSLGIRLRRCHFYGKAVVRGCAGEPHHQRLFVWRDFQKAVEPGGVVDHRIMDFGAVHGVIEHCGITGAGIAVELKVGKIAVAGECA